MIKYIETKKEFDEFTKDKLVLIDFFATWCGPCRMLSPLLEEIDEEGHDIHIVKIDVDRAKEIAIQFGIRVIPTMILLKNGQEIKRTQGYLAKNLILDFIKE